MHATLGVSANAFKEILAVGGQSAAPSAEAVFEEKSVCRKNQNKSAEKHKTQNIKQTQYSNAKYQINLTFCVL